MDDLPRGPAGRVVLSEVKATVEALRLIQAAVVSASAELRLEPRDVTDIFSLRDAVRVIHARRPAQEQQQERTATADSALSLG